MFDSLPGRLFVGSVLFLVVFIGYTPQLVLFLPVYDWQTSLLYLLPLNFLLVMVFYNYYLVVTTDPGSVPKHWVNKRESFFFMQQTYFFIGTTFFYCINV